MVYKKKEKIIKCKTSHIYVYERFYHMKEILKVTLVIIGTIIGAGFASREGDISIFWDIWNKWHYRNYSVSSYNWPSNI